jgi:NADH-quinone oxidoreductase subunit M
MTFFELLLPALVLLPLVGGLVSWIAGRANPNGARTVATGTLAVGLVASLVLWMSRAGEAGADGWLAEVVWPWIPAWGIQMHLAVDGLSLVLVGLTFFLGLMAVGISWREIDEQVGFFHFNILWLLSGVVGVFLALDLVLFYFFWELMLVPMYYVIGIWGHERRVYAALKFFIFTQASGLLMLLAILGLATAHFQATGTLTFDYLALLGTDPGSPWSMLFFLGFVVAFAVKLPVIGLHTWLPDAHTEAPTGGSVILAGLLLKTGAYGLIRFAVPLFPEAAATFAPIGMILGAVGVIYGAVLAFSQTDAKRLVAYTSVSHLGFVLLAVFAWNTYALQGAVMEMVCHGISTGALFMVVGVLQKRLGTRDMEEMSGLWARFPRMGAVMLFFALASLGLPGLGNFIAEFLALFGAFRVDIVTTAVATAGLVAATIYALWLVQQTFHGPERGDTTRGYDLTGAEMVLFAAMMGVLIGLGFYPQPVLDLVETTIATPAMDVELWQGATGP